MFSISVQNTLEYYRNVSLLIILISSSSYLIYLPECKQKYVCVNKVSTNFTYLHQYLPSMYQVYSKTFQQLSFTFRY